MKKLLSYFAVIIATAIISISISSNATKPTKAAKVSITEIEKKLNDSVHFIKALELTKQNYVKDIEKKKLYLIGNLPIKINKFIEKINIQLLKQKYNYQSEIQINKYKLNLNSREISLNKKLIKLTEREIDIILFLNENKKPINIDILQKEVWGYNSELETHTVETHIYRLRKKLKDKFNDEEFILSLKKGYQIKWPKKI